jgi:hypothetical protein
VSESEDSENVQMHTASEPRGAAVPWHARRILAPTMAVEALLAVAMAVRDFALIQTPLATLGSMVLLGISAGCGWAAYEIWVQGSNWVALSLLSQLSVVALSAYIILIDFRSPLLQIWQFDWASKLFPVSGVACILGLFAVWWILALIRRWHGPVTATMKAFVALIPLVGFAQFWLQTDYLPRTSVPVVDITAELTPLGQTDDNIQLEAKVTINNRNSMPVTVGATLMRITAYPLGSGDRIPVSKAIEFGEQKAHAYRNEPLPRSGRELLYAKDILPVDAAIASGQSQTFREVVDFNARTMRLARLAVDAFFITNPRMSSYPCPDPTDGSQESTASPANLDAGMEKVMTNSGGTQFMCREIRPAPSNVVHELVGDRPSFAVMAILNDPVHPDEESPILLWLPGARGKYQPLTPLQAQKVFAESPAMEYKDMAVEYSPSKELVPPK